MQWHSLDDFFAMGGYALYVWGSFGACAGALAAESVLARLRCRRIRETLREAFERGEETGPDGSDFADLEDDADDERTLR